MENLRIAKMKIYHKMEKRFLLDNEFQKIEKKFRNKKTLQKK